MRKRLPRSPPRGKKRFEPSQTEGISRGRLTTTTLDGFGRVIKTARKENDTTWIYTETQYSACSCSSTGKALKTSRPYRTGQTPPRGEFWIASVTGRESGLPPIDRLRSKAI